MRWKEATRAQLLFAPLTTKVMNAVERSYAGTASGINNAVSRIASVLAVAVFGVVLSDVFQSALEERLRDLNVPFAVRLQIESQRSDLAAAKTEDARGERAIKEAFIAGFARVVWLSTGLAIVSSISAAALIEGDERSQIGRREQASELR